MLVLKGTWSNKSYTSLTHLQAYDIDHAIPIKDAEPENRGECTSTWQRGTLHRLEKELSVFHEGGCMHKSTQ